MSYYILYSACMLPHTAQALALAQQPEKALAPRLVLANGPKACSGQWPKGTGPKGFVPRAGPKGFVPNSLAHRIFPMAHFFGPKAPC